jgi:hypothetical protein
VNDLPTQFVSLYSDSLLLLIPLQDVPKDVFLALCKHADFKGWCHAGDELLGHESCHRRDAMPGALVCLQAANYIHVVETPNPYRQKPDRDIQISPYIMRLRPEFQPVALEAWERFNSQTQFHNENQTVTITYGENDLQPDQIQNQIQNQLQNQNHNQLSTPPDRGQTSTEGADQGKRPSEVEVPVQKTAQKQAVGRTELESLPNGQAVPSSAAAMPGAPAPINLPPRWEPKTLAQYRKPLPTDDDENVALDMVSLAGDLSRENARMLVDTYGWDWCEWVMSLYRKESYSVEHPARWMRAMLQKTTNELRQRKG